ncbi:MAG TPA: hypothetical protein VGV59_11890 [Pyrinomonadaceae bacterium]|nr:hypothetical protein [Pyrinomonadaceae bacterium]
MMTIKQPADLTRFFVVFALSFVAACGLCAAQQPAPSPTPAPTQTNPNNTGNADNTDNASDAAKQPDLSITGRVTARELKFNVVPAPKVEFTGKPRRETVWEADRENLPPAVRPGETYRNIGITLRITSVFADIDRIVAEALGEIPLSEEPARDQPTPPQPPPQQQMTPPATQPPTASAPRPTERAPRRTRARRGTRR